MAGHAAEFGQYARMLDWERRDEPDQGEGRHLRFVWMTDARIQPPVPAYQHTGFEVGAL